MSLATEPLAQQTSTPNGRSRTLSFHKSAPHLLQKAHRAGRELEGWKTWRSHLRKRKSRFKRSDFDAHRLRWGLDAEIIADLAVLTESFSRRSTAAESLREWLDDSRGATIDLRYAIFALAWCRHLPELTRHLPAEGWWKLLRQLTGLANEAAATNAPLFADDPLLHQLLAGELALTLACLFPEITACRNLRSAARRQLSAGLNELLDGDGLLQAKHFDRLRPLLGCWTRCRGLGEHLKRGCWTPKARRQFCRFVRNVLRFARCDGACVFSPPSENSDDAEFLSAAATLGGDRNDRAILDSIFANDATTSRQGVKSRLKKISKPAIHSEWASTAVLRPDWSLAAPRLTVLYPDNVCRIELQCGKDVLISGQWSLDVRIDGQPALPQSEWSQTCWQSDKDVDYLELEIELNQGVRVQRHILLARKDLVLFLADAICLQRRANIAYRGVLPLSPNASYREACETHEGLLLGRKPRARLMPLALPEWLCDRTRGSLKTMPHGVQLEQNAEGAAMFAPLFFDLAKHRLNKPLTWRRLTIGDLWTIQPEDAAVGYRIAVGKKQWLVYRSLTPPRNRTVLGVNLNSEFLAARFRRDGETESLIEVE